MQRVKEGKNALYFPAALRAELKKLTACPLTLVQAGSGFGKTTAVAARLEQCQAQDVRCLWYTCLGEAPEQVWAGLCGLLARVDAKTAGYLAKLKLPTRDMLGGIPALLASLQCTGETVLVVDNFQLAGFSEPRGLLEALSLHGCGQLHIVVLTQPMRALRFSTTLPARICQIDQEAFYFAPQDIAAYFKKAGAPLTAVQAQELFRTTEGWIAAIGLQLRQFRANGSLRQAAGFSALLDTALWNRLTPAERDFLLRLSVFELVTPALAAAALGQPALTERGHSLLHDTALIRWDEGQRGYVFHSLLSEYLAGRMEEQPRAYREEVLARAGDACAACGRRIAAARFYARLGAWEKMLAVPYTDQEVKDFSFAQAGGSVFDRVVQACPDEALLRFPEALLLFSIELFLQGRTEQFGRLYGLLERLCAEFGPRPDRRRRRILGQLELIRSFLQFNNIEGMCRCHERAWELMDHEAITLYSRENAWTFGAPSVVYLFWRASGGLRAAQRQVAAGMPCYCSLTGGHGLGAQTAMLAEMLLLEGDDEGAEAQCYKAYFQAAGAGQDSIAFCADLVMARIALLRGDAESYRGVQARMHTRAFEGKDPSGVTTTELCRAFLECCQGRTAELPAWLYDMDEVRRRVYQVPTPFCAVLYLRALLEQDSREFAGAAQATLEMADAMHMLLPRLYVLLYLAVHENRQNRFGAAGEYLAQALALAAPDGVYLPFAELYTGLAPLLKADRHGPFTAAVEAVPVLGARQRAGVRALQSALEPAPAALTPREREIALLLKERMSVKEIAAQLYISESTVKNTMQKIYGKLEVHSKAELAGKNF